ncbi:hypothetical protein AnigIFM50267_005299 [Aspergillus niger]|nr:hypothetical protein AnigIFM50267_005299 [Aspergillus niger]
MAFGRYRHGYKSNELQTQQSHSSSPQSQPKQGFETVLIGRLMEEPELEEGRVKLTAEETAEAAIVD